jgi:hypothetical protein
MSGQRGDEQWDIHYVSAMENGTDGCIHSGVPRGTEQRFPRPNKATLSCIIRGRNSCHVRVAVQQRKSIFTSHH